MANLDGDSDNEEDDWDLTVELTEDGGESRTWTSDPKLPVFGESFEQSGGPTIDSRASTPSSRRRPTRASNARGETRKRRQNTTVPQSEPVASDAFLKIELYTREGILMGFEEMLLGPVVLGPLIDEERAALGDALNTAYHSFKMALPTRAGFHQYGEWLLDETNVDDSDDSFGLLDIPF